MFGLLLHWGRYCSARVESSYFNHLSDVWVIAAVLETIQQSIDVLFQSSF